MLHLCRLDTLAARLDEADHWQRVLSPGEQQRLAIARAVVNRPAILLADEPTANLDADSAAVILEIFRAFHQVGVTVVISTHDPQWMAHLSPRILRLEQGQLMGEAV